MTNKFYDRKPIDELTFADDGMFQEVMKEPQICAELIERLLHIKVGHVEYPELEKQIKPFYTTKGVRLDVYLKDNDKVIDVELQCYPQDALGKRTRYYQKKVMCFSSVSRSRFLLMKKRKSRTDFRAILSKTPVQKTLMLI